MLAFEDLYGGKLQAALDRQYPRDFFDVKLLYDNGTERRELVSRFEVWLFDALGTYR